MKVKKIYLIQHDDDLGPEWLCEDNLKACLFSETHIGLDLEVDVLDVTDIMMSKTYGGR